MLLVEFYKGAPDLVRFQEAWSPEHSYLDKLKVSRRHPPPPPGHRNLGEPLGGSRHQAHTFFCSGKQWDLVSSPWPAGYLSGCLKFVEAVQDT